MRRVSICSTRFAAERPVRLMCFMSTLPGESGDILMSPLVTAKEYSTIATGTDLLQPAAFAQIANAGRHTQLAGRAQLEQDTRATLRVSRPADLAAVLDQQHVKRIALVRHDGVGEQIVRLLGRGVWRDQAEPNRQAVDVRID